MIDTHAADIRLLDLSLFKMIPACLAVTKTVFPLHRRKDGQVAVACLDADDEDLAADLGVLLESPVHLTPAPKETIERLVQEHYGLGADSLDEMPRFVDELIGRALKDRATDIHIEPYEADLALRFRIDGLLHPVAVPAALSKYKNLLMSRLKVMAGLNIAEKRLPQDGRIRFNAGCEEIDIRVSTLPTIHGESLDLRLLPKARTILGLEQLGMSADQMEPIAQLIRKPNGILLATGPTGHGKTTTLYAALSQINTPDKKIITIEDPVEIRLKGVNQIQVHSKIGFTFANGLRSILRQDPDVIMVGEIRDQETAEIAIRSSLTGHLVFSTLHTNDAAGAVARLLDMGAEPYLLASSLKAVLAQRLVRLNCSKCEKKGCPDCRFTGFRGRTGIFEVLLVTDEIRELILKRTPASQIARKAVENGMRNLYFDGLLKVKAGKTTEEEVLRVTEEI